MHTPHLLVTGGLGFIGSNLVHHVLLHTDWSVTVLDKLTYAAQRDSLADVDSRRCEIVAGDVCDSELVDRLVRESDMVAHLAAESHNDRSLRFPLAFVQTNVAGTATVLEAARRHDKRLHHVSTDEVYGDLDLDTPERFSTDSAYRPSSPYSASKAGADHLVRAWVRSFGVRATLSSCTNNYGPRQHIEKFIPRQITNILSGRRPKLYGTGENVRDWIHVEDHAAALLRILQRGAIGETYLVGAECEMTNRDVLHTMLSLMGQSADRIELVNDRPGHDRRYATDPSKIRQDLGWEPTYTVFEDGLRDTIAWYATNHLWWTTSKSQVEASYALSGH